MPRRGSPVRHRATPPDASDVTRCAAPCVIRFGRARVTSSPSSRRRRSSRITRCGYAARPELGPKFWGLDADIRSVGEFVRLYLTRFDRWGSPKFLAGESYGTTRAAHLSGYLTDRGIALNGVVLISTVLNFGASAMDAGNDLGFINFIPSYAATAWYHKKLPADLQRLSVDQVTAQAERWAESDYARSLMRGARLTDAERHATAEQLARFSGTSTTFAEENDLRITLGR